MITNDEVGRRIRQAREEKGLLQADIGRRMTRPRSHAAISDMERGKTKIDVQDLAEIARLLGKEVEYFITSRPVASAVYRRSDREMTPMQESESARAIESFKDRARELARQQREGEAK